MVSLLGGDVLWLIDQLTVSASRQARMRVESGTRSASAERPLPIDLTSATTLADLCELLVSWASRFGAGAVVPSLGKAKQELLLAQGRRQAAEIALADALAAVAQQQPDAAAAARAAQQQVSQANTVVSETQRLVTLLGQEEMLLADGGPGAARWLLRHHRRLRPHPEVGQFLGELLDLARPPSSDPNAPAWSSRGGRAWKVIDHPVDLIPIGECGGTLPSPAGVLGVACACSCHHGSAAFPTPCDLPGGCGSTGCDAGWRAQAPVRCTRRLTAEPGTTMVTCPSCGSHHDVRQRRDLVLADAAHIQARAAHLAAIISAAGLRCSASMIRGLRMRGKLAPTHVDPDGTPWYRLGDVHTALQARRGGLDDALVDDAAPEAAAAQ